MDRKASETSENACRAEERLESVSIRRLVDQRKLDLHDLAKRWEKARVSALRSVVACGDVEADELQLLRLSSEAERETILRRVFDNSRKLGLGLVRHLGLTWELDDVAFVLPSLGSPCFSGGWRAHNHALVLERRGCPLLSPLGSFGCDYWREALDGFVMGVGENERTARHQSAGHGDDACLDILYTETFTVPRVVPADAAAQAPTRPSPRFGEIPRELREKLEALRQRLAEMKVRLKLEGLSEGTLYYQLEPEAGVLCGAGGRLIHTTFEKDLKELAPGLVARDVAPLAVYGGSS